MGAASANGWHQRTTWTGRRLLNGCRDQRRQPVAGPANPWKRLMVAAGLRGADQMDRDRRREIIRDIAPSGAG